MTGRLALTTAVLAALSLGGSSAARAQTGAAAAQAEREARADDLFKEGKVLRDRGSTAEACEKFRASQELSPGIGVGLHLADCYVRLGKTYSAYRQFAETEKLARDAKDRRADVAHARFLALEPVLCRLTVAVPVGEATRGAWEVRLDGTPLARDDWNAPHPVDPGPHEVVVSSGQAPARKYAVRLEAGGPPTTVQVEIPEPAKPVAAAAVVAPAVAPVVAPAPAPPPAPTPPASASDPGATRRYVEYGLLAGGVLGVGAGAALLVAKNGSMSSGSTSAPPQVDPGLSAASKVAFVIGGLSFASVVVVYLTGPSTTQTGVTVTPAPLIGGGGAVLRGTF